jgi:hypothetical protein
MLYKLAESYQLSSDANHLWKGDIASSSVVEEDIWMWQASRDTTKHTLKHSQLLWKRFSLPFHFILSFCIHASAG